MLQQDDFMKTCPECGMPVEDEQALACPKCDCNLWDANIDLLHVIDVAHSGEDWFSAK